MVYEKNIINKRAFIGYNATDVKEYIKELFQQHEDEMKFLQSSLEEETERSLQLKKKLELKEQSLKRNPIAENIKMLLMDLFIQHTKEMIELQAELEEQVREIEKDWNRKLQEKELIKKRFQDIFQDIKILISEKHGKESGE